MWEGGSTNGFSLFSWFYIRNIKHSPGPRIRLFWVGVGIALPIGVHCYVPSCPCFGLDLDGDPTPPHPNTYMDVRINSCTVYVGSLRYPTLSPTKSNENYPLERTCVLYTKNGTEILRLAIGSIPRISNLHLLNGIHTST